MRRYGIGKIDIIGLTAGLLLLAHIVTAFAKPPVGRRGSRTASRSTPSQ